MEPTPNPAGKYPGFTRFVLIGDPATAPVGWTLLDHFPGPLITPFSVNYTGERKAESYSSAPFSFYPGDGGPKFLFGCSGDNELIELRSKQLAAEETARGLEEKVKEANLALENEARAVRTVVTDRDRYERLYRERGVHVDLVRKLEGDIAKIRAAVGEIEMKRILESA